MGFRKHLFFIKVLISTSLLPAQTETTLAHQQMSWTRYLGQFELNNKWDILAEMDERLFFDPLKQNSLVIRIDSRYHLNNNLEVGGGIATIFTIFQKTDEPFNFTISDFRLQQEIIAKQKPRESKFGFNEKLQTEQRFVDAYNQDQEYLGRVFYFKIRLKPQAEYSIWMNEKHLLKAIVSDELILTPTSNASSFEVFDQNRVYTALQYGFSHNFSVELGYLYIYQKATDILFLDKDIIRISFLQKINLHNNKPKPK